MNKAILIGRLTKDPELRTTPTGRNVCQFSVAVSRNFTNANGEREADFINCVVWDKQAENLVKYQKKGNQIAVEGRIQTRNYDDKDGKKVYVTEILASNISFLVSKELVLLVIQVLIICLNHQWWILQVIIWKQYLLKKIRLKHLVIL